MACDQGTAINNFPSLTPARPSIPMLRSSVEAMLIRPPNQVSCTRPKSPLGSPTQAVYEHSLALTVQLNGQSGIKSTPQ